MTALLLDEVDWFDGKSGGYEFRPSPRARAAMAAYKTATLYPHIHALHTSGVFTSWLDQLRARGSVGRYSAADFERLRHVERAWEVHKLRLAEKRQAAKAAKAAKAVRERQKPSEASSNGAIITSPEAPLSAKAKAAAAKAKERVLLPTGLLAYLCTQLNEMPGPRVHAMMQRLRARVERGELLPDQPFEYYVERNL